MKFRFQYDYTLEDMIILNQVSEKAYRRKKVLLTRLFIALLGVGYLFLGTMILRNQSWVTAAIVLLAAVFFLAVAVFYHRMTAWRTRRMMLKGVGELTVDLAEDGLQGYSEKGNGFYPYEAFIGAFYTKGRYLLFADQRHAVLLPERALAQGNLAELKPFLEEKLKKEIIEIA